IKDLLIWKWLKNFRKQSFLEVFIVSMILGGVVIPTFFLQEGTPWNTIQFFYYSLFFSGILAGVVLAGLAKKSYVAPFLIVLLTIPTTIGTLKHYLPSRPPAMVSKDELAALNFLAKQPAGVVLTYPFDALVAKEAEANPPRPLSLYESTAYVSAFAKKPVYLEDEVNLDITGYGWQERREATEKFYQLSDAGQAREFLKSNNIAYLYWFKGQRAILDESQLGISRIFKNAEVDIYKVEK
ncbi:MAG: hypothetical protein UX88_C0016G0009, partial [Candidatus Woesebacteria bacterium GW2011_GWC2_47_16]